MYFFICIIIRFINKNKIICCPPFGVLCIHTQDDAVEKISALALQGQKSDKLTEDKSTTTTVKVTTEKPDEEKYCLTEDCIHSASNVLEQMDQQVEPCEDFYNFACGKFIKNTVIPDDQVSVTTFSLIGERLQEQLRLLVSEEVGENESKPFTIAKNIFKACMNKRKSSNIYFPVFHSIDT